MKVASLHLVSLDPDSICAIKLCSDQVKSGSVWTIIIAVNCLEPESGQSEILVEQGQA